MLEPATEFKPGTAAEHMLLPRRSWADRTWAQMERLAATLRRQGFIARVHFLERWLERARAVGVRLDPATFARQFQQARHYRQTRPGYGNRIAVVGGIPVVYRMGGPRGRHVVLVGVLPRGRVPPVAPARPPRLAPAREAEAMVAFDSREVRATCEQARALMRADPRFRRDAHNFLAASARHWSWRGRTGLPERLGRLTVADIDRLLTCLMSLARALRAERFVDVVRLRQAAIEELRRRGRWP